MMSLKERVIVMCIMCVSSIASATDYAPRKGFLLGFGPAGGSF